MAMKMNFRNKLLVTLIPIVVITVGALALLSYQTSSKVLISQEQEIMEQMVGKTLDELRTEKGRLFFSVKMVCFKLLVRGKELKRPRRDWMNIRKHHRCMRIFFSPTQMASCLWILSAASR